MKIKKKTLRVKGERCNDVFLQKPCAKNLDSETNVGGEKGWPQIKIVLRYRFWTQSIQRVLYPK